MNRHLKGVKRMPISGYFDMKRDIEIAHDGGFWCEACLVGKPAAEQSPDPRYCRGCYEFLLNEAEKLSGSNPGCAPKPPRLEISDKTPIPAPTAPKDVVLNMSPIKGKKSVGDIIQPQVAKVTYEKRGPKPNALPAEIISRYASEGMGSKAIATKLKAEHGIQVSYRTVQRILEGQRVLV